MRSFKRARFAAKALLGLTRGREITVHSDDLFLVSYPKSGNTWMRFLVGNLLNPGEPVTFDNLEDRVPNIYLNTERRLSRLSNPRLLKSHEPFDSRYDRVIYIVRDPRDVAVSYYHYLIKIRRIGENYPIERYVSSFISGELGGYGAWGGNVGSWLGARQGSEGFLLLRYEDLLVRPVEELRKVAYFLSIEDDEDRLLRAIELSSADRMRRMEQAQGWQPERGSRIDKPFVRSAGSEDWKTTLPEASVRLIEEKWGGLMKDLGYLP